MVTHKKNFNWKYMKDVYEWLPLFRGDVRITGTLTVHDYQKFVYYLDGNINNEVGPMVADHSKGARVEGILTAEDECND